MNEIPRRAAAAFERSLGDANIIDLIPPCDILAEQALIGGLMLGNADAIDVAVDLIDADDFYREAHQKIYNAILILHRAGIVVDAVTLKHELERQSLFEIVGGTLYLMALGEATPSSATTHHYAAIVHRLAIKRRLIEAGRAISAKAQHAENEDIDTLAAEAEQAILAATGTGARSQPLLELRTLMAQVMDDADERQRSKLGAVTGIATGFAWFDSLTAGLQPSDLVIIAARPAMGKTALAGDIARAAGKGGKTVAVFSMEMSADQLTQRLLCSEALVDSQSLRVGNLSEDEWARLVAAQDRLSRASILVDDTTNATPSYIRSKCRRIATQTGGLGLVIVDYLQYMDSDEKSENVNVKTTQVAKGLKSLAKELRVPVIALAQLSRGVERRDDKRPLLSDLRDSGSIEAEADLVSFLYRPAYYERKQSADEGFAESGPAPDHEEAEWIIAKQRKGPTGTVKLSFCPRYTRFDNLTQGEVF